MDGPDEDPGSGRRPSRAPDAAATLSQATDLRSETLHDASQAAVPVGTRVRDYEVHGVLAETWSGPVHVVFDHALQRQVALEHWHPAALSTRE